MSTLPKPVLPEPTSTYTLDKLLSLWRRGDLTADQMVGQRSAELTPKPLATLDPTGSAPPSSGASTHTSGGAPNGWV